jgi:hypothetical protein
MTPAECVAQLRNAVDHGSYLHAAIVVRVGDVGMIVHSYDPNPLAILEKQITEWGGVAVGLVGPTTSGRWEASLFIPEEKQYLASVLIDIEANYVRKGYSIGHIGGAA